MTEINSERRRRKMTEKGKAYFMDTLERERNSIYNKIKEVIQKYRNTNEGEIRESYRIMFIDLYKEFQKVHNKYCELLNEKDLQEYTTNWYEPKIQCIKEFQSTLDVAYQAHQSEKDAESTDGASGSDSHKSSSHNSRKSNSSRASSIKSLLLKQVQDKVEMEVKMKKLLEKQEIERQKLDVRFKEEQLEIETSMDIIKEKARVLNEMFDQEVGSKRSTLNPDAKSFFPEPSSDRISAMPLNNPVSQLQCEEEKDNTNDPYVKPLKSPMLPSQVIQEFEDIPTCQAANRDISVPTAVSILQNLNRPPVEIKKFSGDPMEYQRFLRQFESKVLIYTTTYEERLNYLEQFTYGKPNQIVTGYSFLNAEDAYKASLEEFEQRYGDPDIIARAYCKKALNWTPIKNDHPKAIDEYGIFLSECYHAMRSIKQLQVLEYTENLRKLIQKLPFYLHDRWRNLAVSKKEQGKPINFLLFVLFVKAEARKANDPLFGREAMAEDMKEMSHKPKINPKPKGSYAAISLNKQKERTENPVNKYDKNSAFTSQVKTSNVSKLPIPKSDSPKCIQCNNNHRIDDCPEFKNLTHRQKLDTLKLNGICFGCLEYGHMRSGCLKRMRCDHCIYRHPSCLHIFETEMKPPATNEETTVKSVTNLVSRCNVHTRAGQELECTMPIVPVKVRSQKGFVVISTYAFLDSGSSVSFISSELMKQLGIEGKKTKITLDSLTDTVTISSFLVEGLQVYDYNMTDSIVLPRCFSKDKLPVDKHHSPNKEDICQWPHLDNIDIPNPECAIGLMIGNNIPDAYTPKEVRTGPRGSPHASLTAIGWIFWNVLRNSNSPTLHECVNRVEYVNRVDADVISEYEKLNELDNLFRRSINMDFPERTIDDKRENSVLDNLFYKRVDENCKHINGHYYIGLPFKSENFSLPDNRLMVLGRMKGLQQKFLKNPSFKSDYVEFMNSVLENKYAEEVPLQEMDGIPGRKYYISHHGVYHKQKKKIRTVFNCSEKYNGVSLNDMLLSGPDLANNLVGVLIRFRMGKIGLMSDIKAMFHQVKIPQHDRDFLRFFWWPQGNTFSNVKEYRMTSHLFGAVSSPSIANYALQKTALDSSELFDKEVIDTVLNNFYVDDCLRSVDFEKDAIIMVQKLIELCSLGGFQLTKWITNSRAVLETIPESERAICKSTSLADDNSCIERALGVNWDLLTDSLTFKISIVDQPFTRRGLLSIVSSIFDPLGLVAPVLLYPKLLLQELCKKGTSWDKQLDDEQVYKWSLWIKDLPKLEQIHLPRCVKPKDFYDVVSMQLHCFADACEHGYGVACYLRLVDSVGNINCSLILGKSRITPMKKITIPRLELTAATSAVKISKKLIDELKCKVDFIYYWTDSTTVLGYISNVSTRFKTFVANRLSIIREFTSSNQWKKVRSENNAADIASRGSKIDDLVRNKQWFRGPDFLWETQECWPADDKSYVISDEDPEIKRSTNVNILKNASDVISTLMGYYSQWNELMKATSWLIWCKKFLQYLVHSKTNHQVKQPAVIVTNEIMKWAEHSLIKHEQLVYLSTTMKRCLDKSQDGDCKNLTKIQLAKLDPYVDEDGLLRVGGRLSRSEMYLDSKHQIILPKQSKLTELLLRKIHSAVGHLGKNTILSEARKKYWIIGAAKIIKSIISSCIICRKYRAINNEQKMADLPLSRITPELPPFWNCGMDFFGPFEIKVKRSTVKRYGVVFSCFNSRAIHLEVVNSMNTDSCINSIRRFIARRGQPKVIRSDNGSNIVGAVNELKRCLFELNHKRINEELAVKGIQWEFNPPAASHFGGVWERMIRSIRKVLNSLLHEQTGRMDDEALQTLFCEVEAILNNRPLTKLCESPDDLDAITPNHLLNVTSRLCEVPTISTKADVYIKRRWRQVQYLTNIFWKRWTSEYLPCLQERQKWLHPKRNVAVNDIVLIMDSKIRSSWTLARVQEVKPDKKGVVRIAVVKTKSSSFERPINKLCTLLEAEE